MTPMWFKSIKTRMLLLIVIIMVVTLVATVVFTMKDFEKAIQDAGRESAKNIMRLVMLDIDNEYKGLQFYKQSVLEERREQLKNVTAVVFSALKDFYRTSRKGLLSRKKAQKLALNWIKDIRYGNDDYFFVYNTQMVAISHPDPKFMGKSLKNWRDIKGNYVIRTLNEIALSQGSGFYRYWWKRLEGEVPVEKLAYVRYFPQWQWIIGTGVYIDDIEVQVQKKLKGILADLTETFNKIKIAKTGYVFLFNGKQQMLVNPGLPMIELASLKDRDEIMKGLMQAAKQPDRPFKYTLATASGAPRAKEAYVNYFAPLDWYVACSIFTDEIYLPARRLAMKQIFLVALIGLVSIVVAYLLVDRISRPLKRLTAYAKDLPSRDFTTAAEPEAHVPGLYRGYRDEVGRLAASFDFMEKSLRTHIQELIVTTAAKERIDSELKIARDIQMNILPKVFPPFPDRTDFDIYAVIEPAREVGGDFYDFFLLDDQHLCFVIGDVSDKGVPASLYMAVTKTLIKAVAEQGPPPGGILTRVNQELAADNPSSMFVSVFLGMLHTATGRVFFANGGHNPPVVMRASGEVHYLPLSGAPVVGALENSTYKTEELILSPGDSLFLYTDGVTEAVNQQGEFFSEERLRAILGTLPGTSASATVAAVQERVHEFAARISPSDDITMLMMQFRGGGSGS
jgi:sigma-B regulation protein RsbU (phosphoserine phosphatase)